MPSEPNLGEVADLTVTVVRKRDGDELNDSLYGLVVCDDLLEEHGPLPRELVDGVSYHDVMVVVADLEYKYRSRIKVVDTSYE